MPARLNTPSGNPEVSLKGVSRKAFASALVNRMLDKGWQIKSSDEFQVVFKRQLDSVGAMMLFGSNTNAFPEARASYALVERDDQLRVMGTAAIVTNPGSGLEQVTEDRNGNDLRSMQDALDGVAKSVSPDGGAAFESALSDLNKARKSQKREQTSGAADPQ